MTYCLNPVCRQPQNPDGARFCQICGSALRLGDRYRPLKLIGQGGFGKTFLAVDDAKPSPDYCVIKQFLPLNLREQNWRKAADLFRQEAERLADLGHHPQIPKLLDHLEQPDGQYLIQEFISGRNLAQVLANEGAFSEQQIRTLLHDLLPVLQFIHHHQVIHRDVKPENIILPDRRPNVGSTVWDRDYAPLVLVDFGASKYATDTALARTGTVIGSAAYVAPEQAMGRAEFASDLYSLGVTCIHLLTAIHPFDLYSVMDDAWIWRQYLMAPVSLSLGELLDKLLQKATRQRYRTATAVLHDLNQLSNPVRPFRNPPPPLAQAKLASPSRPNPEPSRLILKSSQPWQEQTLMGHGGAVTAIAISPTGQWVASGSSDKTIKLWDLHTGDLMHTFTGRSLWFNGGHSDRIRALAFSPDGHTLISGSDDGTLKWWNMTTQKLISTLPNHGWVTTAIALSQHGLLLASSGGDSVICLWDLATGELIDTLSKHRDQVSALLLSPNGHTLASSSYDKTIRLWDLTHRRLINTLRGHIDRVSAIAVSSDWLTLVSGSWDKTLKIWDLGLGKQVRTLTGHTDRINCLALSPDDQILASGSEDSTIRLWNLEKGDRTELPQNYRPLILQHAWGVNALSFTPDSRLLVSASADETIKIWRKTEL